MILNILIWINDFKIKKNQIYSSFVVYFSSIDNQHHSMIGS